MNEKEIIEILSANNDDFRKLKEEHKTLDDKLEEMSRQKFLTAEEELEKNKLKKTKLIKKDRLADMIRDYKTSSN